MVYCAYLPRNRKPESKIKKSGRVAGVAKECYHTARHSATGMERGDANRSALQCYLCDITFVTKFSCHRSPNFALLSRRGDRCSFTSKRTVEKLEPENA